MIPYLAASWVVSKVSILIPKECNDYSNNIKSINPTIIECDKYNSYENQIPLFGGARGGFMKNKIFKNHKPSLSY